MTPMSVKESADLIGQYLIDQAKNRFTGKVVFSLDLNQGGISRINVNLTHDMTLKKGLTTADA